MNMTYTFLGSKTKQNLEVEMLTGIGLNTEIVVIPEKKGWEYIWYAHGQATETSPGSETFTKEGVTSAHVAKVYTEEDFAVLGLSSDLL